MARTGISKDSLDYERRGRLLRDDLEREAVRRRAAVLLSGSSSIRAAGATSSRAHATAAMGATARIGRGRSREVVFKVVNWTKAQRSPLSQALYAAHARGSDLPERVLAMTSEDGRQIRGGGAIRAEIATWTLKPDRANLSSAARHASLEERARMAVNERLDKRQAAHLILSIPSTASSDPRKLDAAVHLTLDETLGAAGFRYLYTIHTDHSDRPHAHVIVKATSEPFTIDGRQKTRQLRLNPRELEAMRQVFARHAQERGLNVVATRREDRAQLRAEILAGTAPLRENMTLHQKMKQSRQGRAFERSAPDWYKEEGFGYERRRLALAAATNPARQMPAPVVPSPALVPKPRRGFLARFFGGQDRPPTDFPSGDEQRPPATPSRRGGYFDNFRNFREGRTRAADPGQAPPSASPAEQRIGEHFRKVTRDPEAAVTSFKAMARELQARGRGIGLAVWATNNHPVAFGEPTGAPGPGVTRKDAAAAVGAARPGRDQARAQDLAHLQASLRAERTLTREAAQRVHVTRGAERSRPRIARSLAQLATRLESDMPNEPNLTEHVAHIRAVARAAAGGHAVARDESLRIDAAPRQDHALEPRATPAQRAISSARMAPEKARLYQELQQWIRRSDAARSAIGRRDRSDEEGGRQR